MLNISQTQNRLKVSYIALCKGRVLLLNLCVKCAGIVNDLFSSKFEPFIYTLFQLFM